MSKIVFYCHINKTYLETVEFYRQDIDALKTLGHKVVVCTKYIEIPIDFDAMFIWWWTHALVPVLISRILRKPCIITGTYNFRFSKNYGGIDYFRRPFWQKVIIKAATRFCSLNLFVNMLEMKECTKHFGLSNARYYPHTISNEYLLKHTNEKKKELFNLTWSGKQNIIRKGIPEILHAIKILKDEGIKIKLKLAGHEGDGKGYILETINKLKIEEEVSYLGEIGRDEKIKMLCTCEIYIQPSHYEGFGVAIAEAMGAGACVIVCDVGAVREVVGDCGYYVAPGSPKELAKAIKRVFFDDSLRRDLQEKACRRAEICFSEEIKLQRLSEYLSEVGIK